MTMAAFLGGTMERPALQRLLQDIRERRVDVVVVYKIDRLTRSLVDFSKMVEIFDAASASFVSITQQFNTTTSMGRLTLNVLLSFAQFEREVTAERIRDKIAASKKKGMWMGGTVPLGYRVENRKLVIAEEEAETVRHLFARYLKLEIGSSLGRRSRRDQACRAEVQVLEESRANSSAAATSITCSPTRCTSARSDTAARFMTASTCRPSSLKCSTRRRTSGNASAPAQKTEQ